MSEGVPSNSSTADTWQQPRALTPRTSLDDEGALAQFWFEAMLPGVFILDSSLNVIRWNQFAGDLLEGAGLSGLFLTFRSEIELARIPDAQRGRLASFPDRLVASEFHSLFAELVRIFRVHQAVIDTFNTEIRQGIVTGAPSDLTDRLRSVTANSEDVRVYAYEPLPTWPVLIAGVRLAPPSGIKLTLAEGLVTERSGPLPSWIDIVCAWRIRCHWQADGRHIAGLEFLGAQPAVHDATLRHQQWHLAQKRARGEAEADLTRLWSHALGTDVKTLNSARDNARQMYLEGRDEKKEPAYLFLEKGFTQLCSHVGFLRIVRSLSASRHERQMEPRLAARSCSMSALIVSSVAAAFRTLLADQGFQKRLSGDQPGRYQIFAAQRDAWLKWLLMMPQEPDVVWETRLVDLLRAAGVVIATWDLAALHHRRVPVKTDEGKDDETVTSRAIRLLFEEYAYNTFKAILRQDEPALSLYAIADAESGSGDVAITLENSCRPNVRFPECDLHEEVDASQSSNQKGLYSNYRVFTELFGSEPRSYRRTVTADRCAVRLLFPHNTFIERQVSHGTPLADVRS